MPRNKTYKCDQPGCDAKLATPQGLGAHKFRVHGIRGASASAKPAETPNEKPAFDPLAILRADLERAEQWASEVRDALDRGEQVVADMHDLHTRVPVQ